MNEPILCYVDGCWAYFTTQPLDEQWGDDWNDAPYEHNAGTPYCFSNHDKEEGKDEWIISNIVWDGPLETPAQKAHCNSFVSVEHINAGRVPWLQTDIKWHKGEQVAIWAGTTVSEFKRLVWLAGGRIFIEEKH